MHRPQLRRKRQRPIRMLLSAIFIVPLASLIGLWAFAASVTVANAIHEHNFKTENDLYGGSAQGLGTQLSNERLITYEWLSSGRRMPEQLVLKQFSMTSTQIRDFLNGVKAGPGLLQSSSWPALSHWESDLGGPLSGLRAEVESGRITPLAAFNGYTKIINAQFGVYDNLIGGSDTALYQQAAASIEAGRALSLAETESTLITGAFAAGGQMSTQAKLLFAQTVYNKQLLMSDAVSRLDPSLGAGYQGVVTTAPYQSFVAIENAIIGSIGHKGPMPVSPQQFGAAAVPMFKSYQAAESQDRLALTKLGTKVGDRLLLEVGLAGGAGLLAVILSIFLMVRFGRRISRELRGLQSAALDLAENRLPRVVSRLGKGEDVDVAAEAAPMAPGRIVETAMVAEAFSSVQRTAVEAAVGQARLRRGVSQVFRNLAWRSQSLLHRQLALLDAMERKQSEPETLDELFQLDHLTTRMRRHAEGLIILSGSTPGRGWRDPVPVMDVMRAAIAEVEDYKRITVICESQDAVVGTAVADVIHLLAELIENAATYSPASTDVTVRAERVANGFAAEIEDRGIGISPEDIAIYNENLANPPEFDLADSNQLGLFVVARLAGKHSISVTLRRSPWGGTSAIVLLPNTIVASANLPMLEAGAVRPELAATGPVALPGSYPGLTLAGSSGPGDALSAGPARATRAVSAGPFGAAPADSGPFGRASEGPVWAGSAPAGSSPAGSAPVGSDDGLGARNGSGWFQSTRRSATGSWAAAAGPDRAASTFGRPAPYMQPDPDPGQSVWDAGPSSAANAADAADADRPWLPRRQRQASLAPQLKNSAPAPVDDMQADSSDGPNPDGSRALVESLQYGLDLARATPATPDDSWPSGESWTDDPWPTTNSWPAGSWPAQDRPGFAAAAEDAEDQ